MTTHAAPVTDPAVPIRRSGLARLIQRRPLTSFFILAYLGSWILWMPYMIGPDGLNLDPRVDLPSILGSTLLAGVMPGAYLGPLGAALTVTLVAGGKPALLSWRHRLNRWRVGFGWYLVALVGTPAILLVGGMALPGAMDGWQLPAAAALTAYAPMLLLQVATSGLAEEPGWRDFALPIMQYRYGPMRGTLFLGVLWAIWHFPLFVTEWSYMGDRVGRPEWFGTIAIFTVSCIGISYFITWVFNHTKESLPLAILLHASINNMASVLMPSLLPNLPMDLALGAPAIGFCAVALVLVIGTRGRLGYRRPEISPELAVPAPTA